MKHCYCVFHLIFLLRWVILITSVSSFVSLSFLSKVRCGLARYPLLLFLSLGYSSLRGTSSSVSIFPPFVRGFRGFLLGCYDLVGRS